MAPFTFRMEYEILDDSLRVSQVINQAVLIFPEDAESKGIKLVGDVKAWIDENKVCCESPADIIQGRKPRLVDLHGHRIVQMNAAGMSNGRIAEELGCSREAIRAIVRDLGLPPVGRWPA